MSEIQLIVERLNAPPFNKALTLVTFDDKPPQELLQLCNDVFAELDKAHRVDVRDEPPEVAAPRMINFLHVIKFPLPPDVESFGASLLRGERGSIYPVLAYILAKLPQLKKRAYVARFLMPVDIPPEFLHDEIVQDVLAQYQALQSEFKELHKALDKATAGGTKASSPAELRREISQLEDERGQLIEKIAQLKRRTADIGGADFPGLLAATSQLRREQEEESRLQERMHEQRSALQNAEKRYADVNRQLAETRAGTKEDMSAEAVLDGARREASEGRSLARKVLPGSIDARRETLAKLQRLLQEPAKSEEDLYQLRNAVAQLEDSVSRTTQQLAASQRAAGDDKLAMFRQQSALIAKKLAQKEEALDVASRESEALGRELESREAKLSEMSGPKFMKRDEFKAYAAALRTKTATFKQLKQELADLRQETVIVARTEQLLKGRAGDVDAVLRRLEERKGVSGYTEVQSDLEKVSALNARINEAKGKTLTEISRIVMDINAAIKEKKAKLAPFIKELRSTRADSAEREAIHAREKATFDNVSAGLQAERLALERQADALQAEALAEESRFFQLQVLLDRTAELITRARDEAAFEKGEGRYLRDFKTHKELLTAKMGQLDALAKGLRLKQKDIKENVAAHSQQRAKFADLRRLMASKLAQYRSDATGGLLGPDEGGGAPGEAAGLVGFEDLGGANVMTITQ